MTIQRKICFIHVPKCAGTSVSRAITKHYGFFYRKLKKINLYHLSAMGATRGAAILNEDLISYREKLLVYLLATGSYSFITGHFPYSESAMRHFKEEWDFITILRHPVNRWFSQYFFNRRKKDAHFETDLSIEDYIDSEDSQSMGTIYHSYFYGNNDFDKSKLQASYPKVINNINKFACVGVTEHLDLFCRDFFEVFGAKLKVGITNASPFSKKEHSHIITDAVRKKVEAICEPDLKIYNHVLKHIVSK